MKDGLTSSVAQANSHYIDELETICGMLGEQWQMRNVDNDNNITHPLDFRETRSILADIKRCYECLGITLKTLTERWDALTIDEQQKILNILSQTIKLGKISDGQLKTRQATLQEIITNDLPVYVRYYLPKSIILDDLTGIVHKNATRDNHQKKEFDAFKKTPNNKELDHNKVLESVTTFSDNIVQHEKTLSENLSQHRGLHNREKHPLLNMSFDFFRAVGGIIALIVTLPHRIHDNKGTGEYVGSFFEHPKTRSQVLSERLQQSMKSTKDKYIKNKSFLDQFEIDPNVLNAVRTQLEKLNPTITASNAQPTGTEDEEKNTTHLSRSQPR